METDLNYQNLASITYSKWQKIRLVQDANLKEGIFLRRMNKATKQKLIENSQIIISSEENSSNIVTTNKDENASRGNMENDEKSNVNKELQENSSGNVRREGYQEIPSSDTAKPSEREIFEENETKCEENNTNEESQKIRESPKEICETKQINNKKDNKIKEHEDSLQRENIHIEKQSQNNLSPENTILSNIHKSKNDDPTIDSINEENNVQKNSSSYETKLSITVSGDDAKNDQKNIDEKPLDSSSFDSKTSVEIPKYENPKMKGNSINESSQENISTKKDQENEKNNAEKETQKITSPAPKKLPERIMTQEDYDKLRRKKKDARIVKKCLDLIIEGEFEPRRVYRKIDSVLGIVKPLKIHKLKHQKFKPTIPKRALPEGNVYIYDEHDELFEKNTRFRKNCIKRRTTASEIEEIGVYRNKLKFYPRNCHTTPREFLC